jgi:hypothetical protein
MASGAGRTSGELMSHREWRSITPAGISDAAYEDQINYVFAVPADATILRLLVSATFSTRTLPVDGASAFPVPLIWGITNWSRPGDEEPPDLLTGDQHLLTAMTDWRLGGPAFPTFDHLDNPVIASTWFAGTGREPISVSGKRDADGALGGDTITYHHRRAFDPSVADPTFQMNPINYVVWIRMLVLRTP